MIVQSPFETLTPRSSLQHDRGFGILADNEIMVNEHDCLVAMDWPTWFC